MKMSPSSNTRWCPTPEQLMVLEELYRRGVRTPSAAQIQKITAHLSLYGKIQGKNVFYWFQNHKARDRQKLRNKLAKQLHQQHHHLLHHHLYNFPQNHFLDFQISSPFSAHNIHFQGSGVCDEVPDGGVMSRQAWRSSDPPKDCLMRTYGHDSTMVIDVGPTLPCCRSKPLQTLELFPLTSPTTQKTSPTSSLLINN